MIKIEQAPYFELPFLSAAPGRQRVAVRERLPFLRAVVSGLPPGAPPIVATADLQGRSDFDDTDDSLLGCAVADALPEIQTAAGLPAPEASLGLLAGDFYSFPNAVKRGGIGDVGEVWRRMHGLFSRVAGVLGNHDQFDESAHSIHRPEGFLDGAILEMDGLRVGGVSGIVGDSGTGQCFRLGQKRKPRLLSSMTTTSVVGNDASGGKAMRGENSPAPYPSADDTRQTRSLAREQTGVGFQVAYARNASGSSLACTVGKPACTLSAPTALARSRCSSPAPPSSSVNRTP